MAIKIFFDSSKFDFSNFDSRVVSGANLENVERCRPVSRTVTGSAMACQSGQVDEMFSQFTVVSGQYNRTDRVKARELGH
jgi:hypothetical protein